MISILVPGFNEGKVIGTAIQSLITLDYPNYEILVIDDGSKDDMFQIAKQYENDSRVRVIYKPNGGKSSALNRGIEEALGEYVLCMDADSKLSHDVLLKAMSYFESNRNLAALAGNVVVGNPTNLLTMFQKLEYVTGLNFYKSAQSYLGMVNIVPGPIGVFRRKVLLEMNGYRQDTFAEDCDLTLRILMAGYSVSYCPDLVAVTEAPDELMPLIKQRYRWSRGILQAINIQWESLKSNKLSLRNLGIFAMIYTESIIIPVVNFLFVIATVFYALMFDSTQLLGAYFIGLTLLDLSLAAYSVYTEKTVGSLVFLSMLNRITFGLAMEIVRFFSMFDELLKVPMTWGKLKRKGL
jgi:cellulose synthase/poly-beta-1,6-N-acetylglucosamine synthase-like glycosyltransferase